MEYFFFENPFLFVKETVMNTIDAGKNFFIKIEKKFSQLESESQKTVYHNKVFPIMFVAQL